MRKFVLDNKNSEQSSPSHNTLPLQDEVISGGALYPFGIAPSYNQFNAIPYTTNLPGIVPSHNQFNQIMSAPTPFIRVSSPVLRIPLPKLSRFYSDDVTTLNIPTKNGNVIITGTKNQFNNLLSENKDKLSTNRQLFSLHSDSEYKPVELNMIDSRLSVGDASSETKTIENAILQSNPGYGWSMLRLSDNINGVVNKTPNILKYYSGAGVLIFERSHSSGGRNEPTVILFNGKGLYQDLGGVIDTNDYRGPNTLQITAKREALEESASYIDLQFNIERTINNILMYVDLPHKNTSYRCYAIGLDGGIFNIGSFIGNVDKFAKTPYLPEAWKEMSDAKRFYISDLLKVISMNDNINSTDIIECRDVTGAMYKIRSRTRGILQLMLNKYKNGHGNSIADKAIAYVNNGLEYTNALGLRKLIIQ